MVELNLGQYERLRRQDVFRRLGAGLLLGALAVSGFSCEVVAQEDNQQASRETRPFHFELQVNQDVTLPAAEGKRMRGGVRYVQLTPRLDKSFLQGEISRAQETLPLSTREHDVRSPFDLSLTRVVPKVDPYLQQQLNLALARARRSTAFDPIYEQRRLQWELKHLPPTVPMSDQSTPAVSAEMSRELDQQRRSAESAMSGVSLEQANLAIEAERRSGEHQVAVIPLAAARTVRAVEIPQEEWQLQVNDSNAAERELDTELSHARHKQQTVADEIDRQKRIARNEVSAAQPGMDALLTTVRKITDVRMPASQELGNGGAASSYDILWDEWHARFARLARQPLLDALSKNANPSGVDTVSITVTRDHHLNVKVVKESNNNFDDAMLHAYNALDGNSGLEFPSGSLRSSVSFLIDNKHEVPGSASKVESVTSIGDKETRIR